MILNKEVGFRKRYKVDPSIGMGCTTGHGQSVQTEQDGRAGQGAIAGQGMWGRAEKQGNRAGTQCQEQGSVKAAGAGIL